MLSQRPWRTEAVIQLVAGAFACLCLGVAIAGVLHNAGIPAFQSPDSFGNVLATTFGFQGATWVLIFVFLKWHAVTWREALGLRNPNWKKSILLAAGVLVLALPAVLGVEQLSVLALNKMGYPAEDQRAVELLVNTKSVWLRSYLALFAAVIAPVAEEFIFRGVLFPFIKQLGWPRLAWIGTSLLFALIHMNAATFIPLVVLALVFTWLYQKTDCLLASIVAHSLFNTANLIILFTQT
jgi:membrane protease YdiL (CAAX protease family)